jgi:hypothetical protein
MKSYAGPTLRPNSECTRSSAAKSKDFVTLFSCFATSVARLLSAAISMGALWSTIITNRERER